MSKSALAMISVATLLLGTFPVANAGVITQQLGNVDFPNTPNQGLGGNPACAGMSAEVCFNYYSATGDPALFDGLKGSDSNEGPPFTFSFQFSYGPISGAITSATILLGVFEAESARPGSQVELFSLNGVELTGLLDAALEATQV